MSDCNIKDKLLKAKTLILCTNNYELHENKGKISEPNIFKKYLQKIGIDTDLCITIDEPSAKILNEKGETITNTKVDINGLFPNALKKIYDTCNILNEKKFDNIVCNHCPFFKGDIGIDIIIGFNDYISPNGNVYILNTLSLENTKDILTYFGFDIIYTQEKLGFEYLRFYKNIIENNYDLDTFKETLDYTFNLFIVFYNIDKHFRQHIIITNLNDSNVSKLFTDMKHLIETFMNKNPNLIIEEYFKNIINFIKIYEKKKDFNHFIQIVYLYVHKIMLEIQEMTFEKKPCKIVNFKWFSNLCYFNTAIQMIYHIKELRYFLLNTVFNDKYSYYFDYTRKRTVFIKDIEKNFLCSIQKILRMMVISKDKDIVDYENVSIYGKKIYENISNYLIHKDTDFDKGTEYDSSMFLNYMIELIQSSVDMECINKLHFDIEYTKKYNKRTIYDKSYQNTLILPVNIYTTISEIIDNNFKETKYDDYTEISKITSPILNKYLIIFLQIFDISSNKIERNINIEKTILDGTYKLKSCIIHIGTSKSSGHYVFYLFNDDNTVHIINDVGNSITQVPNPTDISGGYIYVYEKINYIPDKLEQSMKELEKQITDPQLMMYQKYLMNEHNKFIKS
jgi:hypothetical protein